jgi:hypothetical protein
LDDREAKARLRCEWAGKKKGGEKDLCLLTALGELVQKFAGNRTTQQEFCSEESVPAAPSATIFQPV